MYLCVLASGVVVQAEEKARREVRLRSGVLDVSKALLLVFRFCYICLTVPVVHWLRPVVSYVPEMVVVCGM